MSTIYAGPGKLYRNSVGFWPESESGEIKYALQQSSDPAAAGMFGRVAETGGDVIGKINFTPFSRWSVLPEVYPAYMGITCGATTGALVIGTQAHTAADVPATIWAPSGRKVVVARTAWTKPPDFHLGVGKALFGPAELTALIAAGKALGDAGAFHTITESAAADPGGQFALSDFIRERWTGAYGTVAGFGGDGGGAMEAEEEWVGTLEVKFTSHAVQKLTRVMILASVNVMIKARLYGPTQTQIDTQVLTGRVLGQRWASGSAIDLLLTSTSGKTVTLKNCDVKGEGFEFGGTKLGIGEVGFVTAMAFTAGAPQPMLIFSA
jgi:hypothetical protein